MDAIEYIWKDRKRILGMPLSFTKYSLSEDRIFLETGLLNMNLEEILLYRVRDISLRISLGQRIFGVGTILAPIVGQEHAGAGNQEHQKTP